MWGCPRPFNVSIGGFQLKAYLLQLTWIIVKAARVVENDSLFVCTIWIGVCRIYYMSSNVGNFRPWGSTLQRVLNYKARKEEGSDPGWLLSDQLLDFEIPVTTVSSGYVGIVGNFQDSKVTIFWWALVAWNFTKDQKRTAIMSWTSAISLTIWKGVLQWHPTAFSKPWLLRDSQEDLCTDWIPIERFMSCNIRLLRTLSTILAGN